MQDGKELAARKKKPRRLGGHPSGRKDGDGNRKKRPLDDLKSFGVLKVKETKQRPATTGAGGERSTALISVRTAQR